MWGRAPGAVLPGIEGRKRGNGGVGGRAKGFRPMNWCGL